MGRPRITIIDGLKYCPYCDSEVEVKKFWHKKGTYDNLTSWCKPCLAAYAAYRRVFSDTYKEWYKRYYTPEKIRAMSQARRDRKKLAQQKSGT